MRSLLVILLASCADPASCPEDSTPSVSVTVRNQDGPDDLAQLLFAVDGGTFRPCERVDVGQRICGRGETGEITVQLIPDFGLMEERVVQVDAEDCVVDTVFDTIEYELTEGCGQVGYASVLLTVSDGAAPILDAEARWRRAFSEEWRPCSRFIDVFSCGVEEAGEFVIEVSAPGFETEVVERTVLRDECHVITEDVEVVLGAG